jgi:hypothetical protein
VNRPRCERKGTLPHSATKIVAWNLDSGRHWKMSCDEHANQFGGPGYWISKLEGYEDNDERFLRPLSALEPSR